MRKLGIILLLFVCAISVKAQSKSDFVKSTYVMDGDTLPLRILYPENFDATKKYPVMLFLHGRGESGNDNEKQLTHGSKMFLDPEFRKNYPTVVVFPQCSDDSYWANVEIETVNTKRFFTFQKGGKPTKSMKLLLAFTKDFFKKDFVNNSRIYLGGLSMGGMGTYELLRRERHTFTAAFAICGGDNVANCKKYKNIPLWIFHGGLDDVVTPQFSYGIYRELRELGNTPKFNLYLKANHNSWDSAFAEPTLLPWLFSHKKD
ncbi:phospholipase [Pedobacter psychrophilus]|uniref:Phospholipase n=1 Tax=Pedobacter psychrophilus TaxID=1826909 RepID=A0A179DDH6_9SPHI|nr:phospholipase [Pedobacter psychrophilus]OAQ39095.1 phospholipase [Pedobacter psychrophilus]